MIVLATIYMIGERSPDEEEEEEETTKHKQNSIFLITTENSPRGDGCFTLLIRNINIF